MLPLFVAVLKMVSPCYVLQYFVSSLAIILLGKRGLIEFYFFLFSECHVTVIVFASS